MLRDWIGSAPVLAWACDADDRVQWFEGSFFVDKKKWGSPTLGKPFCYWLGDQWSRQAWQEACRSARQSGLSPLRFHAGDNRFRGWVIAERNRSGKFCGSRAVAMLEPRTLASGSDSDIDLTSLEPSIPPVVWRRIGHATADFVLLLDDAASIITIQQDSQNELQRLFVGKTIYDVIDRSSHAEMRSAIESVNRTGVTAFVPFKTRDPSGKSITYEGRLSSLSEIDGAPCLVLAAVDTRESRQKTSQLSRGERALRQLLEIHDRERRLIANEIHDGLLQDVIGAHFLLGAILTDPEHPNALRAQLNQIKDSLEEVLREGRRLISDLRPMVIDETGLVNSIEYLKHELAQRHPEVEFETEIRVTFSRLEPILEGTLFRVIKEATRNAIGHGQATNVVVKLLQIGSRCLLLEVRDNGTGFELSRIDPQRYGLIGMRDRAKAFHGGCSVETAPGRGTRLTFRIPLSSTDSAKLLY